MRVCLINPRGPRKQREFVIPHGLLQLSAELKKNGHACDIVDYNGPADKVAYASFKKYDLIGLSVMTSQLAHAIEIADSLDDGMKVVWGGVHCLMDPLSIIKKYKNHFVVSGDGERPLLGLVEHIEKNEKMDLLAAHGGISFYLNGHPVVNPPVFTMDLDSLADMDYHDLPRLEKYLMQGDYYFGNSNRSAVLTVLTSRGCFWDCSFCINSIYRKYKAVHRSKSIDKIRRETERIIDEYKIRIVYPADEDFFSNKRLVEDWKRYATEKHFLWGANCRYNYFGPGNIDEQKLGDLMRSGLFCLGMSIEAGSEGLRNGVLNKRVLDKDIFTAETVIKKSAGRLLAVNTSFVINFPGDDRANRIEMIKWMDRLSRNMNITFSGPQIYRLYPGSRLYDKENKNDVGNIDHYLLNMDKEGSLVTRENKSYESFFYSKLLKNYYNSKFSFFTLREEAGGGQPLYSLARPDLRRIIKIVVLDILFITIRLRVMVNYWRCFYEYVIIAWAVKNFLNLVQKINRRTEAVQL